VAVVRVLVSPDRRWRVARLGVDLDQLAED
jgi:hypothetical protein